MTEKTCSTCKHCYTPLDVVLDLSPDTEIKVYCNFNQDKPLSGCVLTDPFDYYDKNTYQEQQQAWNSWADANEVTLNHTCENYKS